MATKKTSKKKETKANYKASIKVLGKVYESVGKTSKEAVENLKPDGYVKGVSLLSVTNGKVKKDKVLNAAQTFRLFSASGLVREISIKQVSLIFADL